MINRFFSLFAVLVFVGFTTVPSDASAKSYMRSMMPAQKVDALLSQPAAFPAEQADMVYTPQDVSQEATPYYDAPAYAAPLRLSDARQTWDAREGQKLRDVLSVWATREGYALVWDTKYNYVMTADFETVDTFYNAIESIMDEFRKSAKHPKGVVHLDPVTGENFLVVQTKGER